jgi:hypothetical protein
MSLFKRRKRSNPVPANASRLSEPQAPKLVTPVSAPELNRIRAKVQTEVCAIMSRTILQQIQSSDARTPTKDEVLTRQAVSRLYADVLYDLLSGGAAPEIDPAERVQVWAREALEDWARSQTALSPEMVHEREALVESILKALAEAARDKVLRSAAMQRLAANNRLASEG